MARRRQAAETGPHHDRAHERLRLAVAPGDEGAELLERDAGLGRDRRHGEGVESLLDEPLDAALDLVDGARVHEDRLQAGDLGVVEVGPAEVLEPARRRPGRARGRRGDERRELALAQVVTDRLTGDGDIPEDTEDVVP